MKQPEPKPVDVADDMYRMHDHYGVHEVINKMTDTQLRALAEFRVNFLKEELEEAAKSLEAGDAEEYVDAMIDLVVVAVGTLDLFGVDFRRAWNQVLAANMNKHVGVKPSRPNPLGLPDLVKPEGWTPPSHAHNHGFLVNAFEPQT